MNGYNAFADVYDRLTGNIEYKKRAEYLCALLTRYNVKPNSTILDLACGTGSLSCELTKLGYDIIGVDASSEMLAQAQQKKYDDDLDILFLCQDMTKLDLYGTIDACVCTLDSLNHLDDAQSVKTAIGKVGLFMNPDGVFIFDVNTLHKHNDILANNTFVYDCDDVYCVWQNSLNSDSSVDISLDIFEYDEYTGKYSRSSESFTEHAYSIDDITSWLNESEFELLDIFDEMTDKKLNSDTQRAVFAARYIGKTEDK